MLGFTLTKWVGLIAPVGGALGILAKFGPGAKWLRHTWQRKRSKLDTDEGWETPHDALMTFTEPALLEEWTAAKEACRKARDASDQASDQLNGAHQFPREEALRMSENFQTLNAAYGEASRRLDHADDALRADFRQKLRDGVLVARGYIPRHPTGRELVLIPAHEWDNLLLLEVPEEAEGPGIIYLLVRIRRA